MNYTRRIEFPAEGELRIAGHVAAGRALPADEERRQLSAAPLPFGRRGRRPAGSPRHVRLIVVAARDRHVGERLSSAIRRSAAWRRWSARTSWCHPHVGENRFQLPQAEARGRRDGHEIDRPRAGGDGSDGVTSRRRRPTSPSQRARGDAPAIVAGERELFRSVGGSEQGLEVDDARSDLRGAATDDRARGGGERIAATPAPWWAMLMGASICPTIIAAGWCSTRPSAWCCSNWTPG